MHRIVLALIIALLACVATACREAPPRKADTGCLVADDRQLSNTDNDPSRWDQYPDLHTRRAFDSAALAHCWTVVR